MLENDESQNTNRRGRNHYRNGQIIKILEHSLKTIWSYLCQINQPMMN